MSMWPAWISAPVGVARSAISRLVRLLLEKMPLDLGDSIVSDSVYDLERPTLFTLFAILLG